MADQRRLSCNPAEVEEAMLAAEHAFAPALEDGTERGLFLLAVLEALSNAAEHGTYGDPSSEIRFEIFAAPGLALAAVEDQGPGFPSVRPELRRVRGERGRGLGLIMNNSDAVWRNRRGNRITLLKGGQKMRKKFSHVQADVYSLHKETALVTGVEFSSQYSNIMHGLGEIMDHVLEAGHDQVFLDLTRVQILSSSAWGLLFADAERPEVESIVLFNVNPAIRRAAEQMGVESSYPKIKVHIDEAPALELLEQAVASGAGRPAA
jgi:anti-anti-sigma regulatory factor